jgi:hypothetical protein
LQDTQQLNAGLQRSWLRYDESPNLVLGEKPALPPEAIERVERLADSLKEISIHACRLAEEMSSASAEPLAQPASIGYDASAGALLPACYDLLASEARMASFSRLRMETFRSSAGSGWDVRILCGYDRAVLLSWTGTMFEYMMPALWMRTYPDIDEPHAESCWRNQMAYGRRHRIPVGNFARAASPRRIVRAIISTMLSACPTVAERRTGDRASGVALFQFSLR